MTTQTDRDIILLQRENIVVLLDKLKEKDKQIKDLEQQLIDIHHLYQENYNENNTYNT